MDLASLVGLVMCFVLVIFGIVFEGSAVIFSNLTSFVDAPSAIITFGGSLMCVLIMCGDFKDYINKFKTASKVMKMQQSEVIESIKTLIQFSNIARKEGLLALENQARELDDPFLKKGLMLIVDGTEPELVSGIMDTELQATETRHKDAIGFWENMASMGPAWGMIGTLIGLINMLKALDDPSTIGPAMAVALITTLYGSLLANWIATPIATKLKSKSAEEIMAKEILVEGILSIQAGENPRVIEEKLKSFLSPAQREEFGDDR